MQTRTGRSSGTFYNVPLTVIRKKQCVFNPLGLCVAFKQFSLRRDLSRYVFAKECAIRIDKQQKERYNTTVIDNDVII